MGSIALKRVSIAPHWKWASIISLVIIAFDQLTKRWIDQLLQIGEQRTLIQGFLYLEHVRNPGAAWGFLAKGDIPWRGAFFVSVTILAIGMIVYMINKLARTDKFQISALALILGGAVGNLLDRFFYNEVIDFMLVYLGSFPWPNFNVADSAISVGVVVMILLSLKRSPNQPTEKSQSHVVECDSP